MPGTEEVKSYRFSVEEYHRMGEAGIFGEDDRVELIDGEVVEMTPIGWRHAQVVTALTTMLAGRLAERYDLSVQNPLALGDYGEPQPDLALLRRDRETGRLPAAGDALVAIEVSDTSVSYDRSIKLPLYAGSGLAEAWLADLTADRIEVHADPREAAGGYGTVEVFGRGETLRSRSVPGLELTVDRVLG